MSASKFEGSQSKTSSTARVWVGVAAALCLIGAGAQLAWAADQDRLKQRCTHGDVSSCTAYIEAFPNDPKLADMYFARAIINHYVNAQCRLAIDDYTQALRLGARSKGDAAAVYSARGACHEKLGNRDGAIEDYKSALLLDPQNQIANRKLPPLEVARHLSHPFGDF